VLIVQNHKACLKIAEFLVIIWIRLATTERPLLKEGAQTAFRMVKVARAYFELVVVSIRLASLGTLVNTL